MDWVVVVSVLILVCLSLSRVHVLLAMIVAAEAAGVMSGRSLSETTELLISGMGGQANTALSYILLGIFAVMIGYSGIVGFLVNSLEKRMKGKRSVLLFVIAGVACLSQNVIPVHIAFIPILIPPLLRWFDQMKVDRRGVASALTFGLKAPYMTIPVGFGLIFQEIIAGEMTANGMDVSLSTVTQAMILPGIGMVFGLLVAVLISYRKDRQPKQVKDGAATEIDAVDGHEQLVFSKGHFFYPGIDPRGSWCSVGYRLFGIRSSYGNYLYVLVPGGPLSKW